jgi:hypothetical protein
MSPSKVGENLWGADEVERIVKRNADWFMRFIVAGVQGVLKDGRPLYTEKIPEADRLAALLMAPRPFWDALEAKDPETAAALVAAILRAREQGKIPSVGPRANEVTMQDANPSATAGNGPPPKQTSAPFADAVTRRVERKVIGESAKGAGTLEG